MSVAAGPRPERWDARLAFCAPPTLSKKGTWAYGYLATAYGTVQGYNSTNAQGDDFRWRRDLSPGAWKLIVGAVKGPAQAIVTWDVSFDDGASWASIGTRDLYAAAAALDLYTSADFAVPGNGRALLRARALTRHASATGWYMVLSTGELVRTA